MKRTRLVSMLSLSIICNMCTTVMAVDPTDSRYRNEIKCDIRRIENAILKTEEKLKGMTDFCDRADDFYPIFKLTVRYSWIPIGLSLLAVFGMKSNW